jgi:hypothetical protein
MKRGEERGGQEGLPSAEPGGKEYRHLMHVHGSLLDRMDHQRICARCSLRILAGSWRAGEERKALSSYR